jgi:hypothetical protein
LDFKAVVMVDMGVDFDGVHFQFHVPSHARLKLSAQRCLS